MTLMNPVDADIQVRLARPTDAHGIARVHVLAWQWAYRGLVPDEHLDSLSIDKRAEQWTRILNEDSQPATHVGVVGGDTVGFIHSGASRDKDSAAASGEIWSLYLLPEHVGLGVGRALWLAGLDHLRRDSHTSVSVWVLDTNERGRRFYESAGMTLDGMAKDDERDGFTLHELRYRLEL